MSRPPEQNLPRAQNRVLVLCFSLLVSRSQAFSAGRVIFILHGSRPGIDGAAFCSACCIRQANSISRRLGLGSYGAGNLEMSVFLFLFESLV